MERVHELSDVGRLLVGAAHIEADRLELGNSLGPDLVVEGAEGRSVLALVGPDGPAPSLVVGHDGQVTVTLPIGDLVGPDATQSVEACHVEMIGHHVDDDLGDALPADAQQRGDGGLVGALGRPGHHRTEGGRVTSTGSSPGDVLGRRAHSVDS
jgi:hypothetical protein